MGAQVLVVAVAIVLMEGCDMVFSEQDHESTSNITITDVAVVDVEEGVIHPEQMVIIVGDRIQRISPRSDRAMPEGSYLVDGCGLYLMPGLINAHVHYFDPATFGRLMITHGVLMVRDMGHPNEQALQLREALNQGTVLGPEMITTGWVLDGDPPFIPQVSVGCKTPEEGRAAVRRQVAAGVDQIKVYSRLEKDVFLAIVDEAHQHNLKPVGHVPESIYIEEAAAAGQRSSEHLFGFEKVIGKLLGEPVVLKTGGMGSDARYWLRLPEANREELQTVLRRVRDSGMAVCPTVVVFRSGSRLNDIEAGKYPMLEYISPMIRGIWNSIWDPSQQDTETAEKAWPRMQAFVGELHKAGVTLMVGTDLLSPGIIPGYSVHEEMVLWQEAGIPAADVLRSATVVPARFFGLHGRLGTVAEGKTASLVLVKANPLEDIKNAQQIEGVFLRGRYFSRDDLNRLLEEAKDLARH